METVQYQLEGGIQERGCCRCKEQSEDLEKRLLAELPPVLRDYNNPVSGTTLAS